VRMVAVVTRGEPRSRASSAWCGVTSRDPGARGRRRLVVRPAREALARLRQVQDVEMIGPGLPGKLQLEDGNGLGAFAGTLGEHYWLPCVTDYGCEDRDE